MNVDINKDTLNIGKEIIGIIFQCIGAVLCILGIVLIAWPFFLQDMKYWPASCIGLIPLFVGMFLASLKMILDYKFKMKRLIEQSSRYNKFNDERFHQKGGKNETSK